MKDVLSAMVEEEGLVIKSADFEYEDNNGETEYWYDSVDLGSIIYGMRLNITEDEFVERVKNNTIWEVVDVPENIKDKHPRIAVYENDDIQSELITDSFYDDWKSGDFHSVRNYRYKHYEKMKRLHEEALKAFSENYKKQVENAIDEYFRVNCPKYYKLIHGEEAC